MRWVEIAVDATPVSWDAVANIMMESGCGGTWASSAFVSDACARMLGYLPVNDALESRLESIRARVRQLPEFGLPLASMEISLRWVQDDDWADGWKQFFRPIRVGRIVVKPTWEQFDPAAGDAVVEIDPGMAFGTGNHPTTRHCLEALQDLVRGGETVLDMGTGSGILAIASARLGASKVVGIEVDQVAVEVARANVERLGLGDVIEIRQGDSPLASGERADVALANIIASTIIAMACQLASMTRPGGALVASGIVCERADATAAGLYRAGFELTRDLREDEWVTLVMRRREHHG